MTHEDINSLHDTAKTIQINKIKEQLKENMHNTVKNAYDKYKIPTTKNKKILSEPNVFLSGTYTLSYALGYRIGPQNICIQKIQKIYTIKIPSYLFRHAIIQNI